MRRALSLTLALSLAAAGPALAQERPRLAATLAACETGPEAEQRFAVFTGSMPAVKRTRRMSMRFDLEERGSGAQEGARAVAAPKLARWNRSKRGVAGFVYTKRVTRLLPGRWYRAIVRFRWHDARERVIKTARRVTPFCHQPDQRPNLQLESLRAARPGSYLVTIVNAGLTAAAESIVELEPRPQRSAQRPVPPLAPGERTTVVVEAEPCTPGSSVLVQLDSGRTLDESREDDNRVEVACPAADRLGAS